MNTQLDHLPFDLPLTVKLALNEDIGGGDITASLIAAESQATATIISREHAVICGIAWAQEVAQQVDSRIQIDWQVEDGTDVEPNQIIACLQGPARGLLTAERSMLNFLQTLSGTATLSRKYAQKVAHTGVRLLDTRKTVPCLRNAQKYAVRIGGCFNHRMGLYDAFLIKENHISACGSISNAVAQARQIAPGKPVEVEVENLDELNQALAAGADTIMLDNFSLEDMRKAVVLARDFPGANCKLEASGGITEHTLLPVAETGVNYISMGVLTKDVRAVDLSMRFSRF